MFVTWILTVPSVMVRRPAMRLLLSLSAIALSTSSSRGVSSERCMRCGEHRRHRRRDVVVAAVDGAYGLEHVVAQAVLLQEIAAGARFEGAIDLLVPVVRAQDHDPRLGGFAADGLGHGHAVHLRHAEVREQDVRTELAKEVHGLASVFRLADDLEVRLAVDQETRPMRTTA